jgi:hypothetical protein
MASRGASVVGGDPHLTAVAMSPGREGDHEATWKQARRLLKHLSPAEAEVEAVARAFRHLTQQPVTPNRGRTARTRCKETQ